MPETCDSLVISKSANVSSHSEDIPSTDPDSLSLLSLSEVVRQEKVSSLQDSRCGCAKWSPSWLQKCATPQVALLSLCLFAIVQGFVVNGINNVNVTSLERRFRLSTSQVGWISGAYDLSAGLFVLPLTFVSMSEKSGSKPRWLSMAAIIMACGSFVMALPHFVTGLYHYKNTFFADSTCGSSLLQDMHVEERYVWAYLGVFILAQALHGVGGTILFTVGIAYINENVAATASPLYLGILFACAGLGPALGYVIGGRFLEIWVDFNAVDETVSIDQHDPRWVGAWWLGPLVSSSCFLLVAVLFSLFPKRFSEKKTTRDDKNCGATNVSFRGFPFAIAKFVCNPVYMCVTLAGCFQGLVSSIFITYLAKFIQNQFHQSARMAAILTGAIAVPGAAVGQLLSGYLCRRHKLTPYGCLKLCIIFCLLTVPCCAAVWLRCSARSVAGVNTPYSSNEVILQLEDVCNNGCNCTTASYDPVCGPDNIVYFSPCYAGCSKQLSPNDYDDCACVQVTGNLSSSVKSGVCHSDCIQLYFFIPIFMFAVFFLFGTSPPAVSSVLRNIPSSQATFALGVQWVFVRFFGTMPGPILGGKVIDITCLLWQEKYGETGSCWIYDSRLLGTYMFSLAGFVQTFSCISFGLAAYFQRRKTNECTHL